jgi:hypothetical protein
VGGHGASNQASPAEGDSESSPNDNEPSAVSSVPPLAPLASAQEEGFSPEETLIIFDWDDTVLPSSWISLQGLGLGVDQVATADQQSQLDVVAESAEETLTHAQQFGSVVLVTNAETGWIEMSCWKFLPSLYRRISDFKILSARSKYEQNGVTSPFEWKSRAFTAEIDGYFASSRTVRRNVISFGDSAHEREAVIRATQEMSNCRTKSLKLVERPEISELSREHRVISACLGAIVKHNGNLDLCIKAINT